MARDTYEIGPVPNDEACEPCGGDDARSRRECEAYKSQLERTYPNMPSGMYLKVATCHHDFGTYHEVHVVFDDSREDHDDFLWGNLENGCENWDDIAKKELGLDGNPPAEGEFRTPEQLGIDPLELAFASVVPACCSSRCEVEPDGKCSHGHPSVLIHAGLI